MTRIDQTPTAPDPFHPPGRPAWLALGAERVLEPGRPIVDAHHHLFDRPHWRYRDEDLRRDVDAGHRVVATVYLQCGEAYRADGPAHLRPVGETEFVESVARRSAQAGGVRMCAAIVGFADLTLGDAVRPILERHLMVAGGTSWQGGRFCGIRQTLCWDEDARLLNPAYPTTPDMAASPSFRAGFAHLAALGLGFESWSFFH
ncbi:MAG TPA: amidohydrolase, partial [Piscinibacter sp.]|nr:amidohydrolase [Piscinibacter sp.]